MRADSLGASTARLVRGTLTTLAATFAVVATVAALTVGVTGVLGAAVGIGLVTLLFGGSALLLAVVVRQSPARATGVLVGGVLGRLVVYAVVLSSLSGVAWIDPTSLAVATGVAVAVTLAYELHALSRMPRLFWVEDVDLTRPVPSATRS